MGTSHFGQVSPVFIVLQIIQDVNKGNERKLFITSWTLFNTAEGHSEYLSTLVFPNAFILLINRVVKKEMVTFREFPVQMSISQSLWTGQPRALHDVPNQKSVQKALISGVSERCMWEDPKYANLLCVPTLQVAERKLYFSAGVLLQTSQIKLQVIWRTNVSATGLRSVH